MMTVSHVVGGAVWRRMQHIKDFTENISVSNSWNSCRVKQLLSTFNINIIKKKKQGKLVHLWGWTESWESFTEIKLKREWIGGGRGVEGGFGSSSGKRSQEEGFSSPSTTPVLSEDREPVWWNPENWENFKACLSIQLRRARGGKVRLRRERRSDAFLKEWRKRARAVQ